MTRTSPYEDLSPNAYWRSGVADRIPLDPGNLYQPKFPIDRTHRIVTAGSCFAQHVGRTLRNARFNVIDGEPLPAFVEDTLAQKYGYRLFSARYGNIYTVRQLAQLLDEAFDRVSPAEPVWTRGDRYFDSQRPNIEPDGFANPDEVALHRRHHLRQVRKIFKNLDILVFTFGLTEAWVHSGSGTVYPTAPGTIAGTFDPDVYSFKNFGYTDILEDFKAVRDTLKALNGDIRFLITVSPVPLTATASGQHVEVATCYSKSVLRAVCGSLYDTFDDVDYFPSYELITSQTARGMYYQSNMRNVSSNGVAAAMGLFMKSHGLTDVDPGEPDSGKAARPGKKGQRSHSDEVCEEALLEAFAQ